MALPLDMPWASGPLFLESSGTYDWYVAGVWYVGYRGVIYVEVKNEDEFIARTIDCRIYGAGEAPVFIAGSSALAAPGETVVLEVSAAGASMDIATMTLSGPLAITVLSMGLGAYTAPVFWTNFNGQTETP